MVVKNSPFRRLSMILAASNFSQEEITALLRHVRSTPIPEMLSEIEVERSLLDEAPVSLQVPTSTKRPDASIGEPMGQEMTAQVERLLIQEAGLTKVGAAEALQTALLRRHPEARYHSFNSKDGFSRWLKQIATDISLSEILHAAAMIRNSRVHGRGDDWIDKS